MQHFQVLKLDHIEATTKLNNVLHSLGRLCHFRRVMRRIAHVPFSRGHFSDLDTLWEQFNKFFVLDCWQNHAVLTRLGKDKSNFNIMSQKVQGRCCVLMVSTVAFGSSGLDSSSGQCVMFLGNILYYHSACLHPGV